MSEWNLSNFVIKVMSICGCRTCTAPQNNIPFKAIHLNNVREFIKRLKDEICDLDSLGYSDEVELKERIDKLAGDALI